MRNGTELGERTTEPASAKRGRGRPRGFNPQAALSAAGERFRAQGFAGTSLDDLVEATGLARPSLYAAFGDKKALYLSALAATHDRIAAVLAGTLAADLPRETLLSTVFRRTIDAYLTGQHGPAGCIAVSTASTESVRDPEIRAALARFLAMQDECMTRILAQAGYERPAAVARIVMAALHSLAVRARAGVPRAELDAFAADAVVLFG